MGMAMIRRIIILTIDHDDDGSEHGGDRDQSQDNKENSHSFLPYYLAFPCTKQPTSSVLGSSLTRFCLNRPIERNRDIRNVKWAFEFPQVW